MGDYNSSNPFQVEPDLAGRLASAKEAVWFRIGVLQSTMNDRERALNAFERVLAVNPGNVRAMTQAGAVLAKKECYPQAVAYLQRAITADASCGEAWAVLAHCYVMTDDLQKAYQAYQSALSHLPNPRDPNLWYGIGLLYDRYGSLDNALEAFLAVLSISPDFERADEVCFCIGIIYKEQQNFDEALKYFNKVVVAANPPPPLTRADGWYQIGHVNELKRDIPAALEMYKHALAENPKHPKTLQNYGWLEHQHNDNSQEAIRLLKRSADLDSTDGQTWYLLGRVYMALREFRQAYDAYQQAVYRDGRNATFWCSIGVLYYQMNQYRDAMDAYSRAIRLNPYVSEVWYDLGTLYESCGQNGDAIDAYRRAAELAPENTQITARLGVLENSMNPSAHPQQGTSQPQQSAAQPISQGQPQQMQPDMHPSSQSHMQSQLNPALNRQMGGPMPQLPQPMSQDKLQPQQSSLPPSQLHPPPQQMPSQAASMGQPPNSQNTAPLSMPQRNGQMEMAPIPSLRPPNIPSNDALGQNGAFPQDGRTGMPAPLSSMELPPPQSTSAGSHLSPMASQPLPPPMASQSLQTQQPSTLLPPPSTTMAQQDPMHMQRSGPMQQSQLQPLSHPGPQDQQRPQHSQISHMESQQHAHQPASVGQMSSPTQQGQQQPAQQQQRADAQPTAPVHPSHIPSQSSPHMSAQEPHPTQQQSQQHQQQSSHSQGSQMQPQQQQTALPQIQSLPQMPPLSQMQQQQTGEGEKKTELPPMSAPIQQRGGQPEAQSDRPAYLQGEPMRHMDYDRQDDRGNGARLPKLQKPDGMPEPSLPPPSEAREPAATSQPVYAGNENASSVGVSRDQIPPIRESTTEAGTTPPAPARSMSMHAITQSGPTDPGGRTEGPQRGERDLGEQNRQDRQIADGTQSREKQSSADRLPAMSSFSEPMHMSNANRDSRDDAKLLQSVATPSLSLPAPNTLPPMTENEGGKPLSSMSMPGPPVSGTVAGLGAGGPALPPLSSRNPTSVGQDSKDGPSPSVPSGHGASSLTKFGSKGIARTPATPVNNAVAPSSLPSPLPTRKNTGGSTGSLHAARSPRLSKPSNAPPFKSVPVAPPTSSYGGQIESVPSPSSLPVLPALPSRPSHDDDKSSPKSKGDKDARRQDEPVGDARGKSDEKTPQESSDSGRKSEDPLANKPIFGMFRSAPAPIPDSERDASEKEEKMRSPGSASAGRQPSDSVHPTKREGSSKEDSGRTAKRPRLQDASEKDNAPRPFGYEGEDRSLKNGTKEPDSERREEGNMKAVITGPVKPDIPSFKDTKAEMRGPSGSPVSDSDRPKRRDSGGRSGDMESAKSVPPSSQVIDLPRLSTPIPKLSSAMTMSGKPLPSFRSERMNLTASRTGSGTGSAGKSGSHESASRGPLPHLRSAPVSSIPPSMKSIGHSSGRGNGDRAEYGSSHGVEGRGKSVSEDKGDSSGIGNNGSRDDGTNDHVANGENQKGTNGGGELEGRRGNDVNPKEEQPAGRTEIHSSAT